MVCNYVCILLLSSSDLCEIMFQYYFNVKILKLVSYYSERLTFAAVNVELLHIAATFLK